VRRSYLIVDRLLEESIMMIINAPNYIIWLLFRINRLK